MNHESRITNQKRIFFFFVVFVICNLLFVISAQAWAPGDPIVPCNGLDCTKCQLLKLVENIIDFTMLALAPILATVFFIIAGIYLMLGGANPGMLATGKRMFKDTFIGILIVMLAWLITNTLIRTIASTIIVDETTGTIIDTSQWWEISCERIGLD